MCNLYCLACDEIPEVFYDSILFQGGFCSQLLYALNVKEKEEKKKRGGGGGETKQTDRKKNCTHTKISSSSADKAFFQGILVCRRNLFLRALNYVYFKVANEHKLKCRDECSIKQQSSEKSPCKFVI